MVMENLVLLRRVVSFIYTTYLVHFNVVGHEGNVKADGDLEFRSGVAVAA